MADVATILCCFFSRRFIYRCGGHPEGDEGERLGDGWLPCQHVLSLAPHVGIGRRLRGHQKAATHCLYAWTDEALLPLVLTSDYFLPEKVNTSYTHKQALALCFNHGDV